MTGLFGFATRVPSADLVSTISAMATEMICEEDFGEFHVADPTESFGLGRIFRKSNQETARLDTNEDRSLFGLMDGEIYDYPEQRRSLEAAGHRFSGSTHAELLLHGYEASGSAFFRGLHGKFAFALWDAKRRRLILANDRFGMKPIYYVPLSDRLLFSSSLQSLCTSPSIRRQTNLRGVAQFFTFGQLLGEDTLVKDVRLLPAAGWLEFDVSSSKATVNRYWRLGVQPASRTSAESLDRIDAAFQQSVERSVRDTEGLGISLSGGMDARTLLGVAARPDRKLTAVTMGIEGSIDYRSAAAMASIVGSPHHTVVLDRKFLSNYETHLRRMVRMTDGQYLCQCTVMPTLPRYRELGIRVLLRGHAGELMHMDKAYSFSVSRQTLQIRDESSLGDWLWAHLQAFMLDGVSGRLFKPALRNDMVSLARESLTDCLRETANTQPIPHRIWHLFLTQRLRRETAYSMVEFDSVVETRLPYLDNELVDELFAAPPELKVGDTIQAEILRRHKPEFLNVINVNTGTFVGASQLRRTVSKFRMKALAKLGVRGYQPYERLGLWLRRELRPLVERLLLSDRCLGSALFDSDTIRNIVSDHVDGRRNHTYLILALMIFETAQSMFEHDDGVQEMAPVAVGAA